MNVNQPSRKLKDGWTLETGGMDILYTEDINPIVRKAIPKCFEDKE